MRGRFGSWIDGHARLLRWLSAGLAVVAVLVILRAFPFAQAVSELRDWIEGMGPSGPVVYGAIYAVAVVALVPGSLLTLAAGAAFGLAVGLLVSSLSSVAGASVAFLIARHAARKRVERLARDHPRFDAVDRAIRDGGWKIVAMLRLSPAVPFNLQNYLYGLTPIGFGAYVLASGLAMLPGTFLYVYLGHVSSAALGQGRGRSAWEWVALGVGLVATAALTVYLTKRARANLAERTDLGSEEERERRAEDRDVTGTSKTLAFVAMALLLTGFAVFTLIDPSVTEAWFRSVTGLAGDRSAGGD